MPGKQLFMLFLSIIVTTFQSMCITDEMLATRLHPDNTIDNYLCILLAITIDALQERKQHDKADELRKLLTELKPKKP